MKGPSKGSIGRWKDKRDVVWWYGLRNNRGKL